MPRHYLAAITLSTMETTLQRQVVQSRVKITQG